MALFAFKLASHEAMPPKPDLSSNTLSQFLDRFVYRNPKLKHKPRGASIMQPLAGGETTGLLIPMKSKASLQAPVNSEIFSNVDIRNVVAEEVFFHKYFRTIGKGKEQARKKKEKRKVEAADGSEADEDEDEIWRALVKSQPELEGDDDEDMESVPEDGAVDISSLDEFERHSDYDEEPADEGPDLVEDDEVLIGSDDELPDDMEMGFADGIHAGIDSTHESKDVKNGRGKKKRKLKNLPTFASADDYAKVLDGEDTS